MKEYGGFDFYDFLNPNGDDGNDIKNNNSGDFTKNEYLEIIERINKTHEDFRKQVIISNAFYSTIMIFVLHYDSYKMFKIHNITEIKYKPEQFTKELVIQLAKLAEISWTFIELLKDLKNTIYNLNQRKILDNILEKFIQLNDFSVLSLYNIYNIKAGKNTRIANYFENKILIPKDTHKKFYKTVKFGKKQEFSDDDIYRKSYNYAKFFSLTDFENMKNSDYEAYDFIIPIDNKIQVNGAEYLFSNMQGEILHEYYMQLMYAKLAGYEIENNLFEKLWFDFSFETEYYDLAMIDDNNVVFVGNEYSRDFHELLMNFMQQKAENLYKIHLPDYLNEFAKKVLYEDTDYSFEVQFLISNEKYTTSFEKSSVNQNFKFIIPMIQTKLELPNLHIK